MRLKLSTTIEADTWRNLMRQRSTDRPMAQRQLTDPIDETVTAAHKNMMTGHHKYW